MSTLKVSTLSNTAGTSTTSIENAIHGSSKGWVIFTGTGTVTVRSSYNVDSVTDNGTGSYTVNWTTDMSDTNYGVVSMSGATASVCRPAADSGSFLAGSFAVQTSSLAGTVTDSPSITVAAFDA